MSTAPCPHPSAHELLICGLQLLLALAWQSSSQDRVTLAVQVPVQEF